MNTRSLIFFFVTRSIFCADVEHQLLKFNIDLMTLSDAFAQRQEQLIAQAKKEAEKLFSNYEKQVEKLSGQKKELAQKRLDAAVLNYIDHYMERRKAGRK